MAPLFLTPSPLPDPFLQGEGTRISEGKDYAGSADGD